MCQSHMLSRHFFPALVAAKIPRIRFHDLRHTYASLKFEQGDNIIYISKQMGHASLHTTLTRYAKFIPKDNDGNVLSKVTEK